jgi:alkanesulfonate monooxygenase SsuD/methylene tetrahydromethanopterin reductase-like flavin-dependent oxidoreductase (luciferase family)
MRFGIFYEHQLPRPWSKDSELTLFQNALDQCEFADKLGIEYVWEVEHHFLEEYSHSSAPEVFLAAVSQRTKNIRLGHGIMQTNPGYNHPARNAERLATLDLVSGGRVEFGSGESASRSELGGFNLNPAEKTEAWEEGLRLVVRCMTETPFTGHEGKYCSMPPRNVVPKPVQNPHPPLWVACSRHDTIVKAAEKGLGALTFTFADPEEAAMWVKSYRETLAEKCVPLGKAVNPELAVVTPMMVHDDEREAIRRGLEGGNFFGYSLAHYYFFGNHVPGKTNVWEEFQQKRREMGYSPEVALAIEQERLGAKVVGPDGKKGLRGAIGTPDQLTEFLRRYEDAGVDQVIFVLQAGNNQHEHIMESLEIFGTRIMPEFAERDAASREKKFRELQPAIDAAMARRVDDAPPFPNDYIMTPLAREAIAKTPGGEKILEDIARRSATGSSSDPG